MLRLSDINIKKIEFSVYHLSTVCQETDRLQLCI